MTNRLRLPREVLILALLLPALLFLAINRKSRVREAHKHYHFADGAGYFIYLPGWFISPYMEAGGLPDTLGRHQGNAWYADEQGHIVTKYTCGPALMLVPFYLATHAVATTTHTIPANGYDPGYEYGTLAAGMAWCLLGCMLLWQWLLLWVPRGTATATLLLLVLATPLLYYTLIRPANAHVYGFTVLSALLWATHHFYKRPVLGWLLLLAGLLALAVEIRPTNGLAVLLVPAYPLQQAGSRLGFWLRRPWWHWPAALAVAVLVALPQLYYWYYLTGSPVHYSYGQESFLWFTPQLHIWLLAPNNGLLAYSPILLLALLGFVPLLQRQPGIGRPLLAVVLVAFYVLSSWHCVSYGCAFGQRSAVDILPLLALPMAMGLHWLAQQRMTVRYTAYTLMALLVVKSITYLLSFDHCIFAEGNWPWAWYWENYWLSWTE